MKFPQQHTLKEIAEIIDCKYVGDDNFAVLGMNEIHVVEVGDIVFVDHPKYYDKALQSAATIILINKDVDCPEGKSLLISTYDNSYCQDTLYYHSPLSSKCILSTSALICLAARSRSSLCTLSRPR